MQFLVTAYDHPDGLERRLSVRENHLEFIDNLRRQKKCLYAARLEDDNKKPIGSVMVFDYPAKQDLEEALTGEPYIKNKIWGKVEIIHCVIADMFLSK